MLEGRTLLAVGASRGIGKAIAVACARAGARVAVMARERATDLPGTISLTCEEIMRAGGVARGFACDVTDAAAVQSTVSRVQAEFGAIDLLVNSTAAFVYTSVVDTSVAEWDRVFGTNARGAFLLSRAVLPSMIARRFGSIIHLTGSGARDLAHMPPVSGSSKAALERFTLGLAHELREHDIAVNLFDPGPVKSERSFALRGEGFDWKGFATPAEVAPAAVYLASRTASQMTGRIFSYEDYQCEVRQSPRA
jgi:NAD(P)-dependent dehydrogenase (short-subunit alcohol dehydrogenase family)